MSGTLKVAHVDPWWAQLVYWYAVPGSFCAETWPG